MITIIITIHDSNIIIDMIISTCYYLTSTREAGRKRLARRLLPDRGLTLCWLSADSRLSPRKPVTADFSPLGLLTTVKTKICQGLISGLSLYSGISNHEGYDVTCPIVGATSLSLSLSPSLPRRPQSPLERVRASRRPRQEREGKGSIYIYIYIYT